MYAPNFLWTKVLLHLERYFSEDVINDWLGNVKAIDMINDTLIVYAPSSLSRQMLQEKYMPYILEALKEIRPHGFHFEIWGDAELAAPRKNAIFYRKRQRTFDNFIVGNTSGSAVNVIKAAINNPGAQTPIFLYGPSGSGKTHLLYAFQESILQVSPNAHVVYANADQFTGEMIFSLRHGKMDQFRPKYYNTDVLLLDDIQYLVDKKYVQEELACIVNHLIEQKKQIIMTSDTNPKDVVNFENCLKNCFDTGILIGIDLPKTTTN